MRVFVSAVTSELGAVRDRVVRELRTPGSRFRPSTRDAPDLDVVDQHALPQETFLLPKLERAVDRSEIVIALIGRAYGAEPDPDPPEGRRPRRSFTQWEYHFAFGERLDGSVAPRKHVLVYLQRASGDDGGGAPESEAPRRMQSEFVAAVRRSGVEFYEFRDVDDLVGRMLVDLGAHLGRCDRARTPLSIEYPPDRLALDGPPPGPRRVAASVARYDTRDAVARGLSDRLRSSARVEPRGVLLVEGTLGWGKDTLIARALAAAAAPTLWVDLSHASPHSGVVDAVFAGARGLADDEERALERNPVCVSRLVAESVPPDTVVVFANAQWNDRRQVDATVRAAATDLARRGHWVVVEVWSALREQLAFAPSARAEILPPLSRLAEAEVLAWAAARLGRELEPSEWEALKLFDGHPLLLRVALELFAEARVLGDGVVDAEDVALVLESHWERIRGFAEEAGVSGDTLSLRLALWFGLLPWVGCGPDDLATSDRKELEALRRLGLLAKADDGGRWRPTGWARMLGLWSGRDTVRDVSDADARWVESIAASVAPADARAQRRYLAERRQHVPEPIRPLVDRLIATVPIPSDPAPAVATGYEPPAPVVELAPAVGAAGLDLAFWAFEGAARRGDAAAFVEAERRLRGAGAPVRDYLRMHWSAVKSLHTALIRAPVAPAERHELYRTWVSLLPRDATLPAVRAWSARLLAEAAAAARDSGRDDRVELVAAARELIEAVEAAPGDVFARSLNQDTRYAIADAAIGSGTSVADLVRAHRDALEAIPPDEEWRPERATAWLLRSLRHLEFLVAHARDGDEALARLRTLLLRLPLGLEWVSAFERLRSGKHWLPEPALRMLTLVLHARQGELDRARGESLLPRVLACLDDERPPSADAAAESVRAAVDRLGGPATEEACALLRVALVALRRQRRRDTGTETRAYRACRRALDWALEQGAGWAHSRWLEGARREALRFVAAHELGSVRSGDATGDDTDGDHARAPWSLRLLSRRETDEEGRAELDRFERAARRIGRAYETHVATGIDPWLWVDAVERKISLVRARYRMFRASDERRERAATDGAAELDRAVVECDSSQAPPEVRDSVAIRVHKYLWQRPRFLERLRALLQRPLDFRRRLEAARIGASALMPLVFEPSVVAHPDASALDPGECRRILLSCLRDLATALARPASRRLYASVSRCLEARGDLEFWRDTMLPVFEDVGGREDYFATVLRRAEEASLAEREQGPSESDVSESELLDDLTDARMLDVAARLARFGCGDEALDDDVRRRLGDAAVVLAADASLWRASRSRSGRAGFVSQWHEGLSMGVALLQSPDGTVGGRRDSYLVRRDGSKLSWFDAAFSRILSAEQASVGAFRVYLKDAARRLRDALRERRRFVADGDGAEPPAV
ncbi:MAG: DUF4062 domain-containing protein [Planctomycetes bacterium]|nr:DUF4062 domain-containing protein [Planctomycetota bacterium]